MAMDVILSSVKCNMAFVYLDEIVVFNRTVEDHTAHVGQVLMLLDNSGSILN